MKKFAVISLICFFCLLILPVALSESSRNTENALNNEPLTKSDTLASHEEDNTGTSEKENTVTVFLSGEKKKVTVSYFEYTCGSVAAEMPLSYHTEALKAQAVACFTNALRLKASPKDNTLDGADISDDTGTHQGYLSPEKRKQKWGSSYTKYEEKLENAVNEVLNEALTYNGELCIASYFAICTGITENAENVWTTKVPYLVSVKSNGDTLSPDYISTTVFSRTQITDALKKADISVSDKTAASDIFKITDTSKAGTVLSVSVGNTKITGEQLKNILALRSASFTVKCSEDKITFTVKGYGHGVGMSQYGADYMANQGSTYSEILKHYYKGAKIESIDT